MAVLKNMYVGGLKLSFNSDIDRIKEIIQQIEKRSDKGDIKFMCAELKDKVSDLKKYLKAE